MTSGKTMNIEEKNHEKRHGKSGKIEKTIGKLQRCTLWEIEDSIVENYEKVEKMTGKNERYKINEN